MFLHHFSCLDLVGKNGEYSLEYLKLYQRLIVQEQWKYYLAIKGVLLKLGDLITLEVEKLQTLEETTLSSDLAQGFALKAFTGWFSNTIFILNIMTPQILAIFILNLNKSI